MIWATDFEEEVVTLDQRGGGGKGWQAPARGDARAIEYRYFANFAVALVRGRDHRHRPRLGRRPRARSLAPSPTGSTRGSDDQARRQPDRARKRARTTRRPIAASPTSCSSACRSPTSATACRSSPSRCTAPVDAFGARRPRRRADPRLGRVRLRDRARVAQTSASARPQPENVHTLQGGTDWARRARPAAGDAAERRAAVSLVVELVRHRSARRALPDRSPASTTPTRTTAPLDLARRRPARAPAPTSSATRDGRAGLRRHAVRPDRRRRHPGSQGARPRRHADAVHPHGRAGRQRAARSLRRRGAAGLSLARPHHVSIRRPASPARPTRRRRPRRRSRRSSARRRRATFASPATSVVYSGPAEWSLPPHDPAPGASRARRPAASTRSSSASELRGLTQVRVGASTYPFVAALVALAADVKAVLGAGDQGHLRRRLVGILRPSAGRRHAATSTSISIRCGRRPTSTPSASTSTGRSPTGATGRDHLDCVAGCALDLRSRLSARQHARRRGLRLVLRQRRPTATRRCARRSPTAPASRGCSATRTSRRWWLNAALQPAGRHRERDADGLGAAVEAVLVHGDRLPGRRQGRQPAERVRRSEELGDRAAVLSRAARATTSCSAATCRRFIDGLRSGRRRLRRRRQSGLGGLRRAHGRSRPHPRLLLGRAALSGLPDRHRRLGRRRQLARSATGSTAGSPARRSTTLVAALLDDYGFADHDAGALTGTRAGLRHRPRHVGARGAAAAGARLLLRRASRASGRIVFRHRGAERAGRSSWRDDDLVESARRQRAR